MKKLVLGVVALGVMVNVAWAYKTDWCGGYKERYANCLRYESGEPRSQGRAAVGVGCWDVNGQWSTLEKLRMQLEACQIQNSGY